MAGSSKKAIYGAILANTAIAISKFVASAFTGSSAMLSEGIHSLVDTGNGILLLVGINRSKIPPNEKHPFGYGNEIYFWSFVVSMLIFALGGGIALYEGIHHLQHPVEIADPTWNYVVLGLAIVFEGSALRVALKEFRAQAGGKGFIEGIKDSKDSANIAVVVEDSAAVLGLAMALICLILGQLTGSPYFDGLGSVLIGILLISVSLFFAIECKSLLIGEGLSRVDLKKVIDILASKKELEGYRQPLSLYFGPNEVLLNLDVDFKDNLSAADVENSIDQIESEIKAALPKVNRIYIEAENLSKRKLKGPGASTEPEE